MDEKEKREWIAKKMLFLSGHNVREINNFRSLCSFIIVIIY